jgi:hypothetical protein
MVIEPIIASICLFAITGGGMTCIALYEHDKIARFIIDVEKKQLRVEKLKKELAKGK